MGREHVAEQMRGAREFVAAYLSSQELGDELWQQVGNDFGDRWRFEAILSVGCVAASAVMSWGKKTGERPQELIRQFLVEHDHQLDAATSYQTQQATGVVHELLRQPREQAKLEREIGRMGAEHGVFALGALAGVAYYALWQLGQTVGVSPLEALQHIALLDEEALVESGED